MSARSRGASLVAFVLSPACAGLSYAQKGGGDELAELAALDGRVTSAAVLSSDDGQSVLAKLDGWRINPAKLTPEQRAQWLRCYTLGMLACGDALSAGSYFVDLLAAQPDAPGTHRIGWQVALASADGKLAASMLGRLKDAADAERKELLVEQARRTRHVGRLCPDVKLDVSPSELVELPGTRGVFVLEFWNPRKKPDDAQIAAMRARYERYRSDGVRFFGIVAAGKDGADARAFVRETNLNWPHVFEDKSAGAPLTHKAFQASATPMTIVVDADGIMRAASDPADAALEYALRAATAEAEGKFRSPDPRPVEGKPPVRGEIRAKPDDKSQKSASMTGRAREPEGDKPAGEPRNDELAESKLREGRLAMKTGQRKRAKEIFQEIVRDYPGTSAARQAQEYLSSMP